MRESRIPRHTDNSFEGMREWFSKMNEQGLLFHPDDLPEDIQSIEMGQPTFSSEECLMLNKIIQAMFETHADDVYEAAYPFFMERMKASINE